MNVLVVDVGGTHLKIIATGQPEMVKRDSGPTLTAAQMVEAVLAATVGWDYDVVSIGYPGPVQHGRPAVDPHNLGPGWQGFDFDQAFGCPVRVINDAAMQALGSYESGRMLFLGLGTGLGTALIVEGSVQPLELAHLPYRRGRTFEDYVGAAGLARLGPRRWRRRVADVAERLKAALQVEDVVIGGGNARLLEEMPAGARRGSNANALVGGFRLWEVPSSLRSAGPATVSDFAAPDALAPPLSPAAAAEVELGDRPDPV
jgi:polyphosphate glucokinase